MKALLILGAGGHGKVVADAALCAGWSTVAFLDDRVGSIEAPLGLPVLGALSELATHRARFEACFVAVGSAARRLELLATCRSAAFALPFIVHPKAFLSAHAALGSGAVLLAQSAINAGAKLGEGCIVNTGATVDHDCVLEEGVHVCPGAHVAGDVSLGARTWVGIGAAILQGLRIGSDVTIGAGSVVVADIAHGMTVSGVPARAHSGSEKRQ